MRRCFIAAIALSTVGVAYSSSPVARWDVVPYQRVEGRFKVGVVAFHEDGVKVGFAINGKMVAMVAKPDVNPRTGVREFFFEFDAAAVPDGPVNIGAIAKTEKGDVCRLPVLELYADSSRSLGSHKVVYVDPEKGNDYSDGNEGTPFKTIQAAVRAAGDGGTVRLAPGQYSASRIGAGLSRSYWTTIEPAPGVDRSAVSVVCGRVSTERLRFRNLLIVPNSYDQRAVLVIGEAGKTMAWFDGCRFFNPGGRHTGPVLHFGNGLRAFVTGGDTIEMGAGPHAELVRGHAVSKIAGDVFAGSNTLVVNCTIDDVYNPDATVEPDVCRAFVQDGWAESVILYGITAKNCNARAFTGRRVRDMAVVDVSIDTSPASTALHTQFTSSVENALFMNVDIGNQVWQWADDRLGKSDFAPKDVRLYRVKCGGFIGYEQSDGSVGLFMAL